MSRQCDTQTYYRVLNVAPSATSDEIRRGWRSLVLLVRGLHLRLVLPLRRLELILNPLVLPVSTTQTRAPLQVSATELIRRSVSSK